MDGPVLWLGDAVMVVGDVVDEETLEVVEWAVRHGRSGEKSNCIGFRLVCL